MKRTFGIVLVLIAFLCSCSTQKTAQPVKESTPSSIAGPVTEPDKSYLPAKKVLSPLFGKLLSEVSISDSSFNPSLDQAVSLSYTLSEPAVVTVNVYDPDQRLVAVLSDDSMEKGTHRITWDGHDMEGLSVPDEAYFFTIIVKDKDGQTEIYDPTTFSGGKSHDITKVHIDPQQYTINYNMPEMGRVMIRMGIQGGPLMNQLVDWKPRVKGAVTEYWNGMDKDNLINIKNHPNFKMIVTYFSLPENSVIAFGNQSVNYLDYKKMLKSERPLKQKRETSVSGLSPHYSLERSVDYSPGIDVQFTNTHGRDKNGLPILNKKTMVKVTLKEEDKAIFQNHQFEICLFLDHKFYAEDETGYTPFNWVWDLSGVEPGEHLLTVNISSFQDQIGLMSKKVMVVK